MVSHTHKGCKPQQTGSKQRISYCVSEMLNKNTFGCHSFFFFKLYVAALDIEKLNAQHSEI